MPPKNLCLKFPKRVLSPKSLPNQGIKSNKKEVGKGTPRTPKRKEGTLRKGTHKLRKGGTLKKVNTQRGRKRKEFFKKKGSFQ